MRNQATYYIPGRNKTSVVFLMRWERINRIDRHQRSHNNIIGGMMWVKVGLECPQENRDEGVLL